MLQKKKKKKRGGEKSTKNREKGKKDPDKEIGFVRFLHYFAAPRCNFNFWFFKEKNN